MTITMYSIYMEICLINDRHAKADAVHQWNNQMFFSFKLYILVLVTDKLRKLQSYTEVLTSILEVT